MQRLTLGLRLHTSASLCAEDKGTRGWSACLRSQNSIPQFKTLQFLSMSLGCRLRHAEHLSLCLRLVLLLRLRLRPVASSRSLPVLYRATRSMSFCLFPLKQSGPCRSRAWSGDSARKPEIWSTPRFSDCLSPLPEIGAGDFVRGFPEPEALALGSSLCQFPGGGCAWASARS